MVSLLDHPCLAGISEILQVFLIRGLLLEVTVMYKEIIKLSLLMVSLLVIMGSFFFFNKYYRKYCIHMKKSHKDEWWALMKRDSLIETTGEWTRWPLGSIYLLGSVFKISEIYNDQQVENYKKKTMLSLFVFIASFVIFLLLVSVLPHF
jgi:hypothetical protein